MKEKLISVIVPTLNEEKFIAKCLNALNNQTINRKEYEIIVSDSSSEDSTIKIAEKLADKVVICKRISAGFGRNHGAKHAVGKFLAFIDADTIASETWLEGVKESLEKAIAATGPIEALEKDSIIFSLFYKWWSLQSFLTTKLGFPLFPGFNIGVRKNYFEMVNGFSEENITTEDIELGSKLKKEGKTDFNKKMLVHTSTRRVKEVGLLSYTLNGLTHVLFKKSAGWEKRRKEFKE